MFDAKSTQNRKIQKLQEWRNRYSKEELLFNGKPNMARMINNISEYEPRMDKLVNIIRKIFGIILLALAVKLFTTNIGKLI